MRYLGRNRFRPDSKMGLKKFAHLTFSKNFSVIGNFTLDPEGSRFVLGVTNTTHPTDFDLTKWEGGWGGFQFC